MNDEQLGIDPEDEEVEGHKKTIGEREAPSDDDDVEGHGNYPGGRGNVPGGRGNVPGGRHNVPGGRG